MRVSMRVNACVCVLVCVLMCVCVLVCVFLGVGQWVWGNGYGCLLRRDACMCTVHVGGWVDVGAVFWRGGRGGCAHLCERVCELVQPDSVI